LPLLAELSRAVGLHTPQRRGTREGEDYGFTCFTHPLPIMHRS
jgi:hypothetical protein